MFLLSKRKTRTIRSYNLISIRNQEIKQQPPNKNAIDIYFLEKFLYNIIKEDKDH